MTAMVSDTEYTCSICRNAVGRRLDPGYYHQRKDGGFDHARCHTPEMEELAKIFGDDGDFDTSQNVIRLARDIGHQVTIEALAAGYRWRCTCGLMGPLGPDRSAQMGDGHLHLENAIKAGW